MHKQRYHATDAGGSRVVSGRYHRGNDHFPVDQVWEALYLATSPEVCLGEIYRHITPELLPYLNHYSLSELAVRLSKVLDCRDAAMLGLNHRDLIDDTDYRIPQAIGAAAFGANLEGLLVPSATNLGINLVVFPSRLRETSEMALVSSREPRLYVSR
jgi:hypothetical protein